jgi:hypothetical protein
MGLSCPRKRESSYSAASLGQLRCSHSGDRAFDPIRTNTLQWIDFSWRRRPKNDRITLAGANAAPYRQASMHNDIAAWCCI